MYKKLVLGILKTTMVKTKCYNLRLFYFSIYSILLFGCGKKVQTPQNPQEIRRPNLSSQIVRLQAKLLKSGTSIKHEHNFSTDSEVTIPDVLMVNKGNAGNKFARVYFNVESNDHFGFYCNYIGGASTESPMTDDDFENGKLYYFDTCFTEEGDLGEINYKPGHPSIQYQDKSIVFTLLGADPRFDTQATAEFEVEYH